MQKSTNQVVRCIDGDYYTYIIGAAGEKVKII